MIKGCLASYYTDPVIERCRTQPFSLMIDESNDRSAKKRLVILARLFEDSSNTRLLDLPELVSGKASVIFEAIENYMTHNDIPWRNMVGFASDNCNVMLGKNDSVLSRLKEKNLNIFSIGCICHLANLCVKDGLKALPLKVDDLLVDIFYYFKHSSKRIQDFKEFQEFTETDEEEILKHCPTRWLSLERVVNRTLSQFKALQSYFASHEDVEKSGRVKSINERLQDPLSLLVLTFLQFILPQVNKFNTVFQSDKCMIGYLLPEMDRLLRGFLVKFVQMSHVKECKNLPDIDYSREKQHQNDRLAVGIEVRRLLAGADEEGSIPFNIRDKFFECVRQFYENIVKKMLTKFPFGNQILNDLAVLDPKNKEQLDYTSIVRLSEHFKVDVDQEHLKDEWDDFLLMPDDFLPQTGNEVSVDIFWGKVFKLKTVLNVDRFPNMKKVYATLLCLPHSNADSERVFSHVRKVHTEYRKTMGIDTLTSYLQVKLNCDDPCYKINPSEEMLKSAKSATFNYNKEHR